MFIELITTVLPCAKREMLYVRRATYKAKEGEQRVACCRSTYLLTRDTLGRGDLQVCLRVSRELCGSVGASDGRHTHTHTHTQVSK